MTPSDLRTRAQAALGPLEITIPADLAFVIHMRAIQAGTTTQNLAIAALRVRFGVIETSAVPPAKVA